MDDNTYPIGKRASFIFPTGNSSARGCAVTPTVLMLSFSLQFVGKERKKHMTKGNRIYKDRLFKFVFNDKEKLLSLYNALNHSDYKDADALEINTLEDFIYMGMKNDLSFILDSDMCLYEHQSTFNPNMPLRGLFYFADLLQQFVTEKGYNIYSSNLLTLPNPRFVVFYNGDDTIPERSILKLSDAFENKEKSGCLEVEALMLDVNVGKNMELMQSCGYLQDYTTFVGKVKEYKKQYSNLDVAIDEAINYCMEHDIMKELLAKHKAEVARLIFREFDEAEYMRQQEKQKEAEIAVYKEQLLQKDEEITRQGEKLSQQSKQLSQQSKQLSQQSEQLSQQSEQLSKQSKQLSKKEEQLSQQSELLTQYKQILKEHGLLDAE